MSKHYRNLSNSFIASTKELSEVFKQRKNYTQLLTNSLENFSHLLNFMIIHMIKLFRTCHYLCSIRYVYISFLIFVLKTNKVKSFETQEGNFLLMLCFKQL